MPRLLSLALLGAVACATTPRNASNPSAVQAPIDSVGAMEFGDDDVLFVADNAAGRAHAFDFRVPPSTTSAATSSAEPKRLKAGFWLPTSTGFSGNA
ncbi:MAG: hypothetical protein AAFQ77_02765 [Myxococcota bacterium]